MDSGHFKQLGSDYVSLVAYTLLPAVFPFLLLGYANGVDFSSFDDVVAFVGAKELFLIELGMCSSLLVRLSSVERKNDRELPTAFLHAVNLSAAMGLGFTLDGGRDPADDLLAGFAGFLLVGTVAAAPVVCHVGAKPVARQPVIDLRADRDQLIDRIAEVYRRHPDIAADITAELDHQRHTPPGK